MTKQIRYIIITVSIIAVLGVVMLLIKFLPGGKKSSSSSATSSSTAVTLTKIDVSNLTTVHIANATGAYTIRKTGTTSTSSGSTINWTVDEYSSYPLSQSSISNIATEVSSLAATQIISQSGSANEDFGLTAPTATVDISTNDGKTVTLLIGITNPQKSGYYAMIKGDSNIYLIQSTVGDDLTASYQKLIDLSMVSLDSSKLTSLTDITLGGTARSTPIKLTIDQKSVSSYSQTTDSSGQIVAPTYLIISPGSYTANATGMNTITNDLLALSGSDIVSLDMTDKTLEKYGLKNPAYTVTFTYAGTTQTLSFGSTFTKDSSEYIYVTVSGKNMIYDIPTSSVPFYKYELMDVGPSLIYTANNIDTVQTITVTVGSKTWKYSLSGTGDDLKVTSDSKSVTTAQFRNFYQQLISFSPQGTASAAANSTVLCRITFDYRTASTKSDIIELKSLPEVNDPSKVDDYRALCSVNGNANFYVKKSIVDDLATYAQNLLDGKTVPTP